MKSALVGREIELARLREAVGAAHAGTGSLVLVTGEAGIGKTSLVDAALRADRAVWGTSREGPGVPGLWPWAEVLRGCCDAGLLSGAGALAASSLTESSDDDARERFGVFDAIGRALRQAADVQPFVIVLDDLQWADAGTLRFLHFLAADLSRSRLLIVAIYRDGEAGAVLPEGLASRALPLPLRRLSPAEVARLIALLGCAPPTPDEAAAIHDKTGGNPFFVQQVARLGPDAPSLPAGVRDAVRRRVSRLGDDCGQLLAIAAVAGRQMHLRVLAAAADRPLVEVIRALEAAAAAHVIERGDADTLLFAHDLFREVVYADLDPGARIVLHGRIAAALEASAPAGMPGLSAELCRHHVAAATGRPLEALPYVRRAAADAVARMAYEEAAVHLTEGVRLAGLAAEPGRQLELLLDLGDAHRNSGDLGEARARYLEAAHEARSRGNATALARAALGIHQVGAATWSSHGETISLLEDTLARRGEPDDATTARLLAALARELSHGPGDRARAGPISDRAVTLARQLRDPGPLAICLFARHDAMWAPGSAELRLGVLDEMGRAADSARDHALSLEALFGRFVALLELGDPAAYTVFLRVTEAAQRLGQPHYRWIVQSRRAALALLSGRLDEAAHLTDAVAADAMRLCEPDGFNVTGDLMVQLSGMRGELRSVADGLAMAPGVPPFVAATVDALTALDEDDPARALDRLSPWAGRGLDEALGWQVLGVVASIAEVAAAAKDEALCTTMYGRLLPFAGGVVVTGGAVNIAGPVSLYLGMCAAALGRDAEALDHLAEAVSCATRMNARPWEARARYEMAAVLLRRGSGGDRDSAERLAMLAGQAAAQIGMQALVRRVSRLRAQAATPRNVFRRDADVWTLAYDGRTARLQDAKGLRDIARLLANPGKDVAAADLVGPGAKAEAATGADPVLDEQARRAYKRRLDLLGTRIAEAESADDTGSAECARRERQELLDGLSRAYGLGRRQRRLGAANERARKTVTARIRDSLTRIDTRHPVLGRHLRESVVTGTLCSYRPVDETRWHVSG